MKKILWTSLLLLVLLPADILADSFSTLWKQVNVAQRKDLPQTQITLLSQIASKAVLEKSYGNLLKAELLMAKCKSQISSDSIECEIKRFETVTMQNEKKNPILAAVYHCVLGKLYQANPSFSDSSVVRTQRHFAQSMAHPELLAQVKTTSYEPMVVNGEDSRLFNHDLLSLLAYETGDYQTAHDYYSTHYNRAATMMMALNMLEQRPHSPIDNWHKSRYVASLDSLINLYADLVECGEVAIERYNYISRCSKTTNKERMEAISSAVNKWGSWPHINALRNEKLRMTEPFVSLDFEFTTTSTVRPLKGKLEVTNAGKVYISTTKLSTTGWDCGYDNKLDLDDDKKIKSLLIPSSRRVVTFNYAGQPEYLTKEDSVQLSFSEPGVYLVEVFSDKTATVNDRMICYVTDLFVINQALSKTKIRYAVVNAKSGHPVVGAYLRLYYRKMGPNYPEQTVNLVTDKKGEVIFQSTRKDRPTPDYIYAWTETDKAFPKANSYTNYSQGFRGNKTDNVRIYTDRSIYRPGQTVHVALVKYAQDRQTVVPVSGEKIKLTLRNANNKEVAVHELTTDAYGSASTDFTLPSDGLNGHYSLSDGKGAWQSFDVAEYKRPTFEVTLPKVTEKYQDGDTVVVKGTAKTYAGVPVSGGKVSYSISRKESYYGWWWRRGFGQDDITLSEGITTTDKEGHFVVELPMSLPEGGKRGFFHIIANVKITDAAGESHEAELSLPLSNRSTLFTCDMPDKILADSLKSMTFTQTNLAGLKVDNVVNYTIDGISYTAQTGIPVNLGGLHFNSGEHTLHAVCAGDTLDLKFVVFRIEDQQPVVKTHDWSYCTDDKFKDAVTPVYLQVGTSDEEVHVFYTLFSEKGMIENGTFNLNNSIYTRKFYYRDDYGDMLVFNYAWVRDGMLYSHTVRIERPQPDKRLMVNWSTFRDRLVPGQKEEWRLHISTHDGKPAKAQLMSVLYDKSLDQIQKHDWNLNITFPVSFFSGTWKTIENEDGYLRVMENTPRLKDMYPVFSRFDSGLFRWNPIYIRGAEGFAVLDEFYGNVSPRHDITGSVRLRAKPEMAALSEVAVGTVLAARKYKSAQIGKAQADENGMIGSQVRANLQETAFFYPALETDDNGNATLRFTLPESVTTWKFMGLAHDKEMRTGKIEGETVAQKNLMIQPNMPRFLRKGDMATVSSRISNTTDHVLNGMAHIYFINPETDKTIGQQTEHFSVEAQNTTTVSFPVDVDKLTDEKNTVLICKVVAEVVGCSDGEQHYLPILPNQQKVVNTIPFSINGKGETNIDIASVVKSMKNMKDEKISVEYADNPAWFLVQSLPSLLETKAEDAITLSGAFYANALAYSLLHQSPRLKNVIELWRQKQSKEKSAISPLQKNQEVKDLLLSETPWIADAESETEQICQLINLFDENGINNRQEILTEKLMKLQHSDGSFSWFPGMPGSIYVTSNVASTILRLRLMLDMKNNAQTITPLMNKLSMAIKERALGYLQNCMVKQVERMKQMEKKGHKLESIDYETLTQLYLFALDNQPLKGKYKEAQDYLMNILLKQPVMKDIRAKAVAAVVFARTGHTERAKEYVESIKQFTVYNDLLGRYFDGNRAAYYWSDFRMPAQVMAIEALKLVTPNDQQTITEMQRWILQQKHVQRWDSPVVGTEAVYAFFTHKMGEKPNLDILSPCGKTQLFLDGKLMDTDKPTAGVGYVKIAIDNIHGKTLTVKKQTAGTSWGSVYITGMQPMADINNSINGLSVKREILGGKDLKVGDKVTVRLTIKADRDYDFVQLQDRRAACLEPVEQVSGYRCGCYFEIKDTSTRCYIDKVRKGKTQVDIEYYIDRKGNYQNGAATVQCAYAPEYGGRDKGAVLSVKE